MAHTKCYAICESKCHVQTNAGYASRAALDSSFDDNTPLETIYQAMDANTIMVYDIVGASAIDGIYPTNVTQSGQQTRYAVVRIEKTSSTAAVTFMYKGQMWICDIFTSIGGVTVSEWVRVV